MTFAAEIASGARVVFKDAIGVLPTIVIADPISTASLDAVDAVELADGYDVATIARNRTARNTEAHVVIHDDSVSAGQRLLLPSLADTLMAENVVDLLNYRVAVSGLAADNGYAAGNYPFFDDSTRPDLGPMPSNWSNSFLARFGFITRQSETLTFTFSPNINNRQLEISNAMRGNPGVAYAGSPFDCTAQPVDECWIFLPMPSGGTILNGGTERWVRHNFPRTGGLSGVRSMCIAPSSFTGWISNATGQETVGVNMIVYESSWDSFPGFDSTQCDEPHPVVVVETDLMVGLQPKWIGAINPDATAATGGLRRLGVRWTRGVVLGMPPGVQALSLHGSITSSASTNEAYPITIDIPSGVRRIVWE